MKCLYSDFTGMVNCAWLGFLGFLTVLGVILVAGLIFYLCTKPKKIKAK